MSSPLETTDPTLAVPRSGPDSAVDARVGTVIGQRYQVAQLLGRGGMGNVFLAHHTMIGRPVAIKILDARRMADSAAPLRLFREAQAAAAIGHEGIIEVLDVGMTNEGEAYLVMEYLEGEDLAHCFRRSGRFPVDEAFALGERILASLQAAHARGIVHRDVKPSNIFLTRDKDGTVRAKLIDFGVAKWMTDEQDVKLTSTGAVLGTPAYMSPEQAIGADDLDARIDLYALGVILYELVTGQLPFAGANYHQTLQRVIHTCPAPPVQANPALTAEQSDFIDRATEKLASKRFASATDMLTGLRALLPEEQRMEAWTRLSARVVPTQVVGTALGSTNRAHPLELSPSTGRSSVANDTPTVSLSPAGTSSRPIRALAITTLLLLAGGGAAAAFLARGQSPAANERSAPAGNDGTDAAPGAGFVTVTVRGVPTDAVLSFDGKRMSTNPFSVPRSRTISQVRVQAEGFFPQVANLAPADDTEVNIVLDPKPAAAAVTRATEGAAAGIQAADSGAPSHRRAAAGGLPTQASGAAAGSTVAAPAPMTRGTRDSLFTSDFE